MIRSHWLRSQPAVLVKGFIHHIPTLDAAFVVADNGHDVVFHAGQEGVSRHGVSRIVLKHPPRSLAVPDEVWPMTTILFFSQKATIAVGRLPVVLVELRMDELPLQIVLRGCRAEVLLGDRGRIGILPCDHVSIQGPADQEVVLEYVFQRGHILPGQCMKLRQPTGPPGSPS